ncbi:EAL domain-containing protein [Rhizobacter sp. LjRoot28]|jgi:EAL domain-containing protein (putative c-di-GMP-specific phosphodiesterase class I)|uniref:EAL domain-containing protein n=1 Tax=Rhizobacter sp. LjRoot28 TaxID=3342309 RepID=UPI003ECE821A
MLSETRRLPHLLTHLIDSDGHTTAQLDGSTLSSHFQPIYSLSHARVVGHEALLRASDSLGRPMAPPDVFAACRNAADLALLDSLSRVVHMRNFVRQQPHAQWLFLNIHPAVFQRLAMRPDGGAQYLREVSAALGLPGEGMVLEVLETDASDLHAMEAAMATARRHGCLIAIDDFGAGHSNFDRVWRLQPDIVKLDRSLVARAARDRRTQRVVSQMVSLLHECGAMVLMEGVETRDEALVAMEADADMVQGYHFGRPQPALVPDGHSPETITSLYEGLGQRRNTRREAYRNLMAPYQQAVAHAASQLRQGAALDVACSSFLALPGVETAYLLDGEGYQIGEEVWPAVTSAVARPGYEPLSLGEGACWARRPYFRRATEALDTVQTTRPYRTLHGNHSCVTVSCAFMQDAGQGPQLRVVCGDIVWDETAVSQGRIA